MLHIGLALSAGPLHGYAVMQAVESLTAGRVSLGPGTLYRSLHRMQVEGLIEEHEDRPDSELDDERRRYYVLTRLGREVLEEEVSRLRDLVRLARERGLLAASSDADRAPSSASSVTTAPGTSRVRARSTPSFLTMSTELS